MGCGLVDSYQIDDEDQCFVGEEVFVVGGFVCEVWWDGEFMMVVDFYVRDVVLLVLDQFVQWELDCFVVFL